MYLYKLWASPNATLSEKGRKYGDVPKGKQEWDGGILLVLHCILKQRHRLRYNKRYDITLSRLLNIFILIDWLIELCMDEFMSWKYGEGGYCKKGRETKND